ncbi:hypothetical protein [Erythrobacter sp. EC-HK427]|uniref:hypothetical protein n=1 Tax=Erythrobacter sp. EC-HK427 TaxID=2038396 RepID=UPI0012595676|nr:hypothetical protein [Erythrobacter sp. EC-HK427]VVS98063.1 conserved exported hypothetical protein [Erythrobacter sp. EC-HK427]
MLLVNVFSPVCSLGALLLLAACAETEPDTVELDPFFPEDAGAIIAPVPLAEASELDGQLFPSYLLTTQSGCSYPAIDNPTILDEFSAEWYGSHLNAAGEPPLTELAAGSPERLHIRFIWLRTFDQPMIVRIHEDGPGQASIEAKRLSGAGGYEPGEFLRTLERELSSAEWEDLMAVIAENDLENEAAVSCNIGNDGAQWILEVVENGDYSFYERWTPETGNVRNLGLHLLQLTGWNLEPIY